MSDIKEKIDSQIKNNKVILYMKGNREMPQCGFSARVVQILDSCDVMYETVDVLMDPEIRQGIKDYSNWPTIPQLYVNGEFIGGCDICVELFQNGELQTILNPA
jgi:monothiol glutaredoxin